MNTVPNHFLLLTIFKPRNVSSYEVAGGVWRVGNTGVQIEEGAGLVLVEVMRPNDGSRARSLIRSKR